MFLRLIAFVSIFALGSQVFAQAVTGPRFQVLACPAVGTEYEQMLSKLDSLKASIKKDANCANVQLKVESLEQLVTKDREAVMNIVTAAAGQPLTEDQAKTVRDYAENVTKKVAALNDLFTQANSCFQDDQQDKLAVFSGFVGEASQLVASLSGPWGAPIAIAGNVIAGFMTGLDAIYKTRAGYDFTKPEQWKGYVTSLCTYFSYRDQIQHLLDPTQRLVQLQDLRTRLDKQIDFMVNNCADCREIAAGFSQQKDQTVAALNRVLGQNILRADQTSPKPYGTYVLQSLGLREWVINEQARVKAEAQTYWADAAGRYLLSQAKDDIESFLIKKQAPKFMTFGIVESRNDFNDFRYFVSTEGRPVFAAFQDAKMDLLHGKNLGWGWNADPLTYFNLILLQPIDWAKAGAQSEELQFQFTNYRDQSLDRFRNAQSSTQMVQTFCAFFRHASLYNSDLHNLCTSPDFADVVNGENAIATKLTAGGLIGAAPNAATAEANGSDVFLNRVEALTKEIEVRGIGQ